MMVMKKKNRANYRKDEVKIKSVEKKLLFFSHSSQRAFFSVIIAFII